MHERSPSAPRSRRAGPRLVPWYALVAAVLGATVGVGQPVPDPQDRDPFFQAPSVQPAYFAVLTLGGGANPSVGAFQCADMLIAGTHPWITAWDFYEPTLSPREVTSMGATALAAHGTCFGTTPLGEVALILAGERGGCWQLKNPEEVRPIPPYLLKEIRDGKLISSQTDNGKPFEAFVETIRLAHETSPAAFRRAARRDVAFNQLFRYPDDYRGQVVHVEGRLRLLQKDAAPATLKLAGVQDLYYAWVFDEMAGDNPYCVVLTEAPANVAVNQKVNQRVTFDGYFYMKRRYKAEDSKKANEYRDAPVLIGHSLAVPAVGAVPADGSADWPKGMLWGFLALAAGVMLLVGGLAYWFRWNDAQVRRRLTASRQFVDPATTDEEPPAWSLTSGPAFSEDGGEPEPPREW